MTRNQIFGVAICGAIVMIAASSLFSTDTGDYGEVIVRMDGESGGFSIKGSVQIEQTSDGMLVHNGRETINCTKNGGRVVITRKDGSTTEIICE